ncbi:Opr family porin [Arcobacter cloacae]|uniref:Porin domain-containing protein n=1 Tax=Arcobacter cloacae TaxID=1054034 RepID=A0A4Q0ZQ24_9BACT|nr:Opr family porin [Arcobacter cloacae]RXJ85916.1 hypothetical protein CRU90_01245 [Arcobacter cloacae]
MKKLLKNNSVSLVACGLILSSTMAFGADTIDAAFKEGKVSGSLSAYGISQDNKQSDDSAFSSGAVSLAFETASLYGFSAKAGFIGVHVFDEKNDGDADDIASKSLMSEAYINYTTDGISATIGRQAIDLEWMGDFHEAAVVAVTAIPDTTIVLGYSQKMAVAGVDEVSETFNKFNGDKGAYVLDVKYTGLEGLEFNPYAYSAPDLADWYGLKATFTADMFGAVAHYAASNEDVAGTEDGSIGHVELNTTISDFTAALGYIKTDKDGGAGNMYAVGDNISPFEDGNYVYDIDARTVYGSVGYSIAGVDLGALYGQTKYVNDKEKELNLTVGYSFTESLAASLLYADVDANSSTDDYNKVLASVEYTF